MFSSITKKIQERAEPKRYLILGHSGINYANANRVVPRGVRLVFLSQCGKSYTKNWYHHTIFKNKNKTNNFLMSNKVTFYEPGTRYRNQEVQMPEVNNAHPALLHGIYKLPVNMERGNRKPSYVNKGKTMHYSRPLNGKNNLSRGASTMRISSILDMISKKGGGTVIGAFCRGLGNVSRPNTNNYNYRVEWPKMHNRKAFGKKVQNKRNQSISVNALIGSSYKSRYLHPKGGLNRYKSLRTIGERRAFKSAIKKSENIRPVPGPSGIKKTKFFGFIKRL